MAQQVKLPPRAQQVTLPPKVLRRNQVEARTRPSRGAKSNSSAAADSSAEADSSAPGNALSPEIRGRSIRAEQISAVFNRQYCIVPPLTIIRRKEVEARTGLSRSTIYNRVAVGTFPAPVNLGARAVGWVQSEIDEWLAARVAESRRAAA